MSSNVILWQVCTELWPEIIECMLWPIFRFRSSKGWLQSDPIVEFVDSKLGSSNQNLWGMKGTINCSMHQRWSSSVGRLCSMMPVKNSNLLFFCQKRTLPVTNVTNASAKIPSICSHFGEADFAHASPGIGSLREAGQPIHCRSLPSRQGPMPDSTMSDSGRREMVWNKYFDSDIYWNDVLIAFQWCFNASEICNFVFKCLKTS